MTPAHPLAAVAVLVLASGCGSLDHAPWQSVPASAAAARQTMDCRSEVRASDFDFFDYAPKGFRPLLEANTWRWAYTDAILQLCSGAPANAPAQLSIYYAVPPTVLAPGRAGETVRLAVNGRPCCEFTLVQGKPDTQTVAIPGGLLRHGQNSLRLTVDPESVVPSKGQPIAFIFVSARLGP